MSNRPAPSSFRVSPFLIAFLASLVFIPLAGYSLFYSLLVSEITPFDQSDIPTPNVGDRISIYGVWVEDTEFTEIGIGGWYEIHPVRYIVINGKSFGELPYHGELMSGVWNPSRLLVLDDGNPYRIANGTVAETVFNPEDGDYHVHLLVDNEYLHLLRTNPFATALPLYQILKSLAFTPIVILVAYFIISLARPDRTSLGRLIRKQK